MKWLENTIAFLIPSILIDSTPWRELWNLQEQEAFVRLSKFTLPAVAMGWLGNHFLFDVPMGLEPIAFWFNLRISITILFLVSAFYYWTPLASRRAYKLPAYVSVFAICYAQAWITVWYGKEAWFFFFLFVLVGNLILRLNPFQSLIWNGFVIGVSSPIMFDGGVGFANFMSGTIAVLYCFF